MADIYYTPSSVSESVVSRQLSALVPGAIQNVNGFTYVDGTMLANVISPVLAEAIYIGRLVREGIGTTEEFVTELDVSKVFHVTVQMQNMMDITTRTIGPNGTTGNNGLINFAPQMLQSTTPFDIPLNQINDQGLFFPFIQMQTAPYDVVVRALAAYADTVTVSMDTYHIATAVAYAAYRAVNEANQSGGTITAAESASNVIQIDTTQIYTTAYMVQVNINLNNAMANGDIENNLMTFSGAREIIARPKYIGWNKTPLVGYINNASEIGQKILLEPQFDLGVAEAYGSQYRGEIQGYRFMEANDTVWNIVEKWLGLSTGALNYVYGIVFTPQAYATGGAFTKIINIIPSSQHNGLVAFPYHKFGGAAYRKMFLIVDKNFTFPAALIGSVSNPVITPKLIVAPAQFGLKPTTTLTDTLAGGPSLTITAPHPANTPVVYNISGTCIDSTSTGITGVTITGVNELGATFTATTASNGTYTLSNVTGTVTVTPTISGKTFTPTSQTVSYNGDITGISFVGL